MKTIILTVRIEAQVPDATDTGSCTVTIPDELEIEEVRDGKYRLIEDTTIVSYETVAVAETADPAVRA